MKYGMHRIHSASQSDAARADYHKLEVMAAFAGVAIPQIHPCEGWRSIDRKARAAVGDILQNHPEAGAALSAIYPGFFAVADLCAVTKQHVKTL